MKIFFFSVTISLINFQNIISNDSFSVSLYYCPRLTTIQSLRTDLYQRFPGPWETTRKGVSVSVEDKIVIYSHKHYISYAEGTKLFENLKCV